MYAEGEDIGYQFEPDWKAVFQRDFCKMCKNRRDCPLDWVCHDMKVFIEENECYHANMDNDDTDNGDM